MVANLMRTRRRNERHQSLQQLVTLHQDVGRAVAPRGLETQGEPSIGAFFETVACERGAGDVTAEPLEPTAVLRGDGDVGAKAQSTVLGDTERSFGIGVARESPFSVPSADATSGAVLWAGPLVRRIILV